MNAYLVASVGAVAAGWVAWQLTGWLGRVRERHVAAERFERWMRQERQITQTLDEIRRLPEAPE